MRKPDLAIHIADKVGLSRREASEVLSVILDQITNALSRQDSVTLIGFGTFEVRHRSARSGKNPQTGKSIQIAASNSVGFKPGKAFKDALN